MDFAAARTNMVEAQLRTNKVTDEGVLDAMRTLPREDFVPAQSRHLAYIDEDVALGNNRFLMEPMIVARLVQAAQLQEGDSVLVVGAGYMAAVAGKISTSVFAIEEDKDLSASTSKTLTDLAMDHVVVLDGDLTKGCADQGPYTVILFDGSIEEVPAAIADQLVEGGRMAAVISKDDGKTGDARIFVKNAGHLSYRSLFDANIQPLPGFAKEKGFVF